MMPARHVPSMLGDIIPRLFAAAESGEPVILTVDEHAALELHKTPNSAIATGGKFWPLDSLTYHIIPNTLEEWKTTT